MADEAPRVSKRKGLLVRLTVAPAVMAFLFGVLAWHASTGHAYGTDVVLVLFAAGAAYEVAAMTAKAGRPAHLAIAIVFAGALAGLGLFAPDSPALRSVLRSLLLVGCVLAIFVRHLRAPQPGDLDRILATLLPVVFVGYLFGLLRELGDGSDGAKRILFVTFSSKASDIGGWVVGKSIGRHKMIPSVSPGKTWRARSAGSPSRPGWRSCFARSRARRPASRTARSRRLRSASRSAPRRSSRGSATARSSAAQASRTPRRSCRRWAGSST